MYKKIIIIVFIFLSMNIFSQENNIYQQYLNVNNIPLIIDFKENDCYIDNSIIVKDFQKFVDFVILKMEIIVDNIANVEITRTSNGGPFKRKYIRIIDGEINITEDNSQLRLVYDPSYPYSIKDGPKKGYVEFSNVNIVTEMVDLIVTSRILETILIKGLKNQIINNDEYEQTMEKIDILLNKGIILIKK